MIRNQKGFTLVEMMFSVGASAMVAYAIFAAMSVTTNTFDANNVRMTIQTSAREGLYRMIQEIRESAASKVTINAAGDTIQFYVPNSSSPVTAGYATNWGHQIQFSRGSGANSTKIIRTDLTSNTTTVMASDVTAVTFTGNAASSPTKVTALMSVQRAMLNGRNVPATALQITGQAKLRNT